MILYKIDISQIKKNFHRDEKILLVYLGNLYSEVYITLNSYMCSDTRTDNSIIERAQFCQRLYFLETLAGKLWEGWQIFEKKYFGSQLSLQYSKTMKGKDKAKIKALSKYFNNPKNKLKFIRNNYSNHFGLAIADKLLENFEDLAGEDQVIYLSEHSGNCFFQFAETAMVKTLLDVDSINSLHNEIFETASDFLDCIFIIFSAALIGNERINQSDIVEIEMPEPPSNLDKELPYFLKPKKRE